MTRLTLKYHYYISSKTHIFSVSDYINVSQKCQQPTLLVLAVLTQSPY